MAVVLHTDGAGLKRLQGGKGVGRLRVRVAGLVQGKSGSANEAGHSTSVNTDPRMYRLNKAAPRQPKLEQPDKAR